MSRMWTSHVTHMIDTNTQWLTSWHKTRTASLALARTYAHITHTVLLLGALLWVVGVRGCDRPCIPILFSVVFLMGVLAVLSRSYTRDALSTRSRIKAGSAISVRDMTRSYAWHSRDSITYIITYICLRIHVRMHHIHTNTQIHIFQWISRKSLNLLVRISLIADVCAEGGRREEVDLMGGNFFLVLDLSSSAQLEHIKRVGNNEYIAAGQAWRKSRERLHNHVRKPAWFHCSLAPVTKAIPSTPCACDMSRSEN